MLRYTVCVSLNVDEVMGWCRVASGEGRMSHGSLDCWRSAPNVAVEA